MSEKWLDSSIERKEAIVGRVRKIFDEIENEDEAPDKGQRIFEFFLSAIEIVPDYFWTNPSSTTGKYHPEDEFGEGGLALHTYKCLALGESMLRGMLHEDLCTTREKYNIGGLANVKKCFIIALALHDSFASGKPGQLNSDKDGKLYTDGLHMLYVRSMLEDVEIKIRGFTGGTPTLAKETYFFNCIMCMIEGHYGPWSPNPQVTPADPLSKLVYFIDYIVSRKFVQIDVATETD